MRDPTDCTIRRATRLDLVFDDRPWPFADQRRAEIDSYFARTCVAQPKLWNGRVLLARDASLAGDTYRARYFETDFASFLAWRDWGFPDAAVANSFGMGALRGSDGGFILGQMAEHTANAGKIYFASGTPDPTDLNGDRVDIAASVMREITEETGLTAEDYAAADAWDIVAMPCRVALMRPVRLHDTAAGTCARIAAFIAGQREPEFSAVHIVRSAADIVPAMPDFVAAYLRTQFDATLLDG